MALVSGEVIVVVLTSPGPVTLVVICFVKGLRRIKSSAVNTDKSQTDRAAHVVVYCKKRIGSYCTCLPEGSCAMHVFITGYNPVY